MRLPGSRHITTLLLFVVWYASFECLKAFGEEESLLNDPGRTEWQAGGFYEGIFEDGTPFQMNLPYPVPKSIDRADWPPSTLDASYWYPRRFSGNTLSFRIKSFGGNAFTAVVQATDKKGNTTDAETFEGVLSPDKASVHGLWTNIRQKKKMTFTMKRVVEYKGVDVLVSRKEEQEDPDRPFIFSSVFPVFGNSTIDGWIRNISSACDHDLECNNHVEVAWFSKASFSLYGVVFGYSQGMAHGNSDSVYQNYIATKTGPKTVNLSYFINTSDSCLDSVSRKIIASLKKRKYSQAENGDIDVQNARFLPTPQGILFDFDPYEVGSYSEGAPSVFIERQKIGKCIKYLPRHD